MAALTPTLTKTIDLGGGSRQLFIFDVTPQADGDTVALSSYVSEILDVEARITAGADANLSFVEPTFSGTTVTLAQKEQDYTAATDWTGASIRIKVIGVREGV